MRRIVFFSSALLCHVPNGYAQDLAQSHALQIGPSIVDQFPSNVDQLDVDAYMETLSQERFGAPAASESYLVQTLDTEELGSLARAPVTQGSQVVIDYRYVFEQLRETDRLGAALAAQAAGDNGWVSIATDSLAESLPFFRATGQTEDLARALGIMSQVQLGGLGETPLTSMQLDLGNGTTVWRVDGQNYTLPIENAPVSEVMRWADAGEVPNLMATFEPESSQFWSELFDQYAATNRPHSEVDWEELVDLTVRNGTYLQLDQLFETDPAIPEILAIDYSPEARIENLEAVSMDADVRVQLGRIYLSQGDPISAVDNFQSALTLDSDNLRAQVGLAQIALLSLDDQIEGLPDREGALDTLLRGQSAGLFEASFTIASSENIVPPEQRLLASVVAQDQATSAGQSLDSRNAQSSNCRAAAAGDGGGIQCQFFDIAYITNRNPIADGAVLVDFGIEIVDDADLSIGILRNDLVIEQSIPDDQPGLIARGSCVGWGVCVPVEVLRPEASDTGFQGIGFQYEGSVEERVVSSSDYFLETSQDPSRALIFIHGFNTDFREAVDALTNLMITARYPSTPFLLSWPSEGRLWERDPTEWQLRRSLLTNYPHDRNMVTNSCVTMHSAVSAVVGHYGAGNVDLLIHSMGNQLLYEMLTGCGAADLSWPTELGAPFRFLIMSSPDLSVANFQDELTSYADYSETAFIYGTENDLVLGTSGYINQREGDLTTEYVRRLGFFSEPPMMSEGINWINTITVDGTSEYAPLNHSHYLNTAPVRRDIAMILNGHSTEGPERCVLPVYDVPNFFYISPGCL